MTTSSPAGKAADGVVESTDARTFERADNRQTLAETSSLITTADEAGAAIRLLGGAAVAVRCQSARWPSSLARGYSDVDFVVRRKDVGVLQEVLESRGYEGDTRFNTLNGHRRLSYGHPLHGHLDVFVDEFAMCHRIDLGQRLDGHPETVRLGDLLLTKLQIARLTQKDLIDIAAIFLDLPEVADPSGEELARMSEVLTTDWGWWRTVSENLDSVATRVGDLALSQEAAEDVGERIGIMRVTIEATPKSMRWRARARVGDRVAWREEPEGG